MIEQPNKTKLLLTFSIVAGILILVVLFMIYNAITKPSVEPITSGLSPTLVQPTLRPVDRSILNPKPLTTQLAQQQTESDENWDKTGKEIDVAYPWLDRLPLQKDSYFVYFDLNTHSFVGKIYDTTNQDEVKKEVTDLLTQYGIDLNKYPIDWQLQ